MIADIQVIRSKRALIESDRASGQAGVVRLSARHKQILNHRVQKVSAGVECADDRSRGAVPQVIAWSRAMVAHREDFDRVAAAGATAEGCQTVGNPTANLDGGV